MAVMPLSSETFRQEHKAPLLVLARQSIQHGVVRGSPVAVIPEAFHPDLQQQAAAFVTLKKAGDLRGCIGSLVAHRPLINDVANNAFAAAFHDNRFNKVSAEEVDQLHIGISVLTPAEPISFSSETELLEAIEPNVDGLILRDGQLQGTFLPSVWAQLPDKQQFLQQLKLKAGMSVDYWSQSLKAYRYHTISIEE